MILRVYAVVEKYLHCDDPGQAGRVQDRVQLEPATRKEEVYSQNTDDVSY